MNVGATTPLFGKSDGVFNMQLSQNFDDNILNFFYEVFNIINIELVFGDSTGRSGRRVTDKKFFEFSITADGLKSIDNLNIDNFNLFINAKKFNV